MRGIFTKITLIIILVGCNNRGVNISDEDKLRLQITQQQKTIDSLKRVKTVSTEDIKENVRDNQEKKPGFDLNKISDGRSNSPIIILDAQTNIKADFSGVCTMRIKNNYEHSTSAILLDIGISKKKINCKVGANGTGNCKIYLTEKEMENFMPVVINEEMIGLRVEKVVFVDGYQWQHFESKW